jgi:hypothetical protein
MTHIPPAADRVPAEPATDHLLNVRRVLAALVAVEDLDPVVAGSIQLASTSLDAAPAPPVPIPPQRPSHDVPGDLRLAAQLLEAAAGQEPTAAGALRLAHVARDLLDALAQLLATAGSPDWAVRAGDPSEPSEPPTSP